MKPDINAIKERAEKATPGPWDIAGCNGELTGINGPSGYNHEQDCIIWNQLQVWGGNDADFIAHARQDIPALLAYIEQLISTAKQVIVLNDCNYIDCGRCPGGGCDLHKLGILLAQHEEELPPLPEVPE